MRFSFGITTLIVTLVPFGLAGCQRGTDPGNATPAGGAVDPRPAPPPSEPAESDGYAVRGVVTELDPAKPAVTIDHEEIPGFMQAMTMEFSVDDPRLLDGLEAGDAVEGRLVQRDGRYVLSELRKGAPAD